MCRDRKAETEGRGRRRPARARRGVGFVVGFLGLAKGASARASARARAAACRRGGAPRGGALAGLTAPALESAAAIESARLLLASSSDPRIHLLLFFWIAVLTSSIDRSLEFVLGRENVTARNYRGGVQVVIHCARTSHHHRCALPPYRRALSLPARRRHPLPPPGLHLRSRTSGLGAIFPDFTPSFPALDAMSVAMSPALYVVSPHVSPGHGYLGSRHPPPSLMISFARVTHDKHT